MIFSCPSPSHPFSSPSSSLDWYHSLVSTWFIFCLTWTTVTPRIYLFSLISICWNLFCIFQYSSSAWAVPSGLFCFSERENNPSFLWAVLPAHRTPQHTYGLFALHCYNSCSTQHSFLRWDSSLNLFPYRSSSVLWSRKGLRIELELNWIE